MRTKNNYIKRVCYYLLFITILPTWGQEENIIEWNEIEKVDSGLKTISPFEFIKVIENSDIVIKGNKKPLKKIYPKGNNALNNFSWFFIIGIAMNVLMFFIALSLYHFIFLKPFFTKLIDKKE